MKKVFSLSLLIAAMVMGFTSCNKEVKVTGITLSKTTLILEQGKSEQLVFNIVPSNATNKEVIWKSADEKIATIDQRGIVKAVAKGETSVTVTTKDGNKSDICKVTVTEPALSTVKIEINVQNGKEFANLMDSIQAIYWTKELKEVDLLRIPYNDGKLVFELPVDIDNNNLKTIVEYYREIPEDSLTISDKTAMIAPIGFKGTKDGKVQKITLNPFVKVKGALFTSGIYLHSNKKCDISMEGKMINGQKTTFKVNLVKGYNLVFNIQKMEGGVPSIIYTTESLEGVMWTVWK